MDSGLSFGLVIIHASLPQLPHVVLDPGRVRRPVHLDLALVLQRYAVLMAEGLELQLDQRLERRRDLPRRHLLGVQPLDALGNLRQGRP